MAMLLSKESKRVFEDFLFGTFDVFPSSYSREKACQDTRKNFELGFTLFNSFHICLIEMVERGVEVHISAGLMEQLADIDYITDALIRFDLQLVSAYHEVSSIMIRGLFDAMAGIYERGVIPDLEFCYVQENEHIFKFGFKLTTHNAPTLLKWHGAYKMHITLRKNDDSAPVLRDVILCRACDD